MAIRYGGDLPVVGVAIAVQLRAAQGVGHAHHDYHYSVILTAVVLVLRRVFRVRG